MNTRIDRTIPVAPDTVEQASRDSFPASDAPAHTPTTAIGPPDDVWTPNPMPEMPLPVEIKEHPVSDPDVKDV